MRFAGDEAEVVEVGAGAVGGAVGERGLELARQALADGVAQHVARVGHQLGRRVEDLVRRDAGVGAAGDVAHGVGAGLARGQAGGADDAHDVGARRPA